MAREHDTSVTAIVDGAREPRDDGERQHNLGELWIWDEKGLELGKGHAAKTMTWSCFASDDHGAGGEDKGHDATRFKVSSVVQLVPRDDEEHMR